MSLQRIPVLGLILTLGVLTNPALAGPISPEIFLFDLSGAQETQPVTTPAKGGCIGRLDEGAATFAVTCTHDVVGATLIHIHKAPAGTDGPVVFDLGPIPDPPSPVVKTWESLTAGDIADLRTRGLYVNIHTDGRPAGIIRGQITKESFDTLFFADGAQQVPPSLSTATGTCLADLDDAATQLAVGCTHNVVDATVAHIHTGAPGVNGPDIFTFDEPPTSPFTGVADVTDVDVADFVAGFLYVNIHSVEDPGGEIRGQIAGQLIFTDGFESGDTASWSSTVR